MMKLRWMGLLGVFTTIIASTGADAQTTTLYYQSNEMTGTSDYLTAGATSLTTAPVFGSLSGTIVLTGSIAASDLELGSYSFSFSGNDGSPFTVDASQPSPAVLSSGTGQFLGPGGLNFSVITSNGAITGVSGSPSASESPYGGFITLLSLEPSGDTFRYEYANNVLGGCENQVQPPGTAAGQSINPCDVNVSSSAAGVWTVETSPVPLPPSIWLFLSATGMLAWVSSRRRRTEIIQA
jgi:hypothetical protein